MAKHHANRKQYRSTFEDRIVPAAEARGAKYEPTTLEYPGGVKRYKPDLILPNGIVVEIKGWFTAPDRVKMLRVKAAHPQLDIRFVFQNAQNRLSKTSKTTYAAWCEKHGFLWAEHDIPTEWYAGRGVAA